jgi:hypothetical protein
MSLTISQISSLLNTRDGSGSLAFVGGEWKSAKLTGASVGTFVGRAGTVQRNRKGVARRLANGSRRYYNDESEIQAYTAPRVVK